MRLDRRRLRVLLIAAAGVVAAALGLVLGATGALDGAESLAVDQRYQVRGTNDVPDDIVVVGIGPETPDAIGARPPFKRSIHAAAIRNLTGAGARTIVYDLQFSEKTDPFDRSAAAASAAESEDLALLDAITASKRVVLGTDELTDTGPNILFTDEDLAAANASVGGALFQVESGSIFRRLPYEVGGLKSLAVVTAERDRGKISREGFGDGGAWIDYHGPTGTLTSVAFEDVVTGRFDRDLVRDSIVVVGNTAQNLGDVERTPFDGIPMSGAEIQANAISTVLRGIPLRDAAAWLDVLAVVGLTGLATLAALRRSALVGILAAAVLIAVYLVLVQLAFDNGRVLDVAAPVLSTAMVGVAGLAINYWLVVRDRSRLRAEFARFLPAAIVDDVLEEAGDSGRIGGRRVYATVMFADLRGFTAAAERLPPEVVIDVLNRYLTEMSDAVLDHGGTLVAYQGDGLMAVFGAPVEQTDHADRAVAAAREMRDARLPRFNAWAAEHGLADGFRMGIGLASGPVMSGNVGSERRLEYAAVGDTTNAAARLESLTKETPHMLLVSDTTRAALTRPLPDLTAVGALDVRGRQVPASVWTIREMDVGPADDR
jgi:adenylate cyclase